jgi:hypothetical protein
VQQTFRAPRTWWFVAAVVAGAVAVVMATRPVGDDSVPTPAPSAPHEPVASTTTDPATPSTTPEPGNDAQQRAAVRAGVRTIQAFLDTYRRDGIVVASREYLAGDQLRSPAGVPRLSSGTVLDASISSWRSADDFTLEVSLDLHFRGTVGSWDQGENDRFVTLTRTGDSYRLSFATSP